MSDDRWRLNAIGALDDARSEIIAATEPTFVVIMVVSEADLLRERPVSFYANLPISALGPMLSYCGARVAAFLETEANNV